MKGFTLIELLIVMAILAILSAIGVSNFRNARIKALDLNRKSDLQSIAKSLEAYANDHKSYPLSDTSNKIICQAPDGVCTWGTPFTDGETIYMATLPKNFDIGYIYISDGIKYSISTYLANSQDPDIQELDQAISSKCGVSNPCNYQVKSTNQ